MFVVAEGSAEGRCKSLLPEGPGHLEGKPRLVLRSTYLPSAIPVDLDFPTMR